MKADPAVGKDVGMRAGGLAESSSGTGQVQEKSLEAATGVEPVVEVLQS